LSQSVERGGMEREAHRAHAETLGSSAQMRCVSWWYRKSRVTVKSAIRTTRTIQTLMRIRAGSCRRFVPADTPKQRKPRAELPGAFKGVETMKEHLGITVP